MPDTEWTKVIGEIHDRRTKAALQACTGIPTEALEVGAIVKLINALDNIAHQGCCGTPGCSIDDPLCYVMEARAALATLYCNHHVKHIGGE